MIGSNGREFADCGHPWAINANGRMCSECEMEPIDQLREQARRRGKHAVKSARVNPVTAGGAVKGAPGTSEAK